jgi:hypothetical protein
MSALRPMIHTLSLQLRRLCCCVLDHPFQPLPADPNEVWLSGDRKPQKEFLICSRCLIVKRRMLHGKSARL